MKILLAEDDVSIAKNIQFFLKKKEHTVVWFESGIEAVEHLEKKQHLYDAVITDMSMPGACGIDLLKAVNTVSKPIPFYVHSSHDFFGYKGDEWELANDIPSFFPFAEVHLKPDDMFKRIGTFLDKVAESK